MSTQTELHYQRIAEAITYLQENFKAQPQLDEVAKAMHLSPYHFQRLFTDWAGVSPKKFLQYVTIAHAKKMLKEPQATLFDVAIDSGLSGSSRLHDLFINIEGMSPGEYKNGGEALDINYSFADSPFGKVIIASTAKGVCHMAFAEDEDSALTHLKNRFPRASYYQVLDMMQQKALHIFTHDWAKLEEVKLHLKGTDFQLKVWESLLSIPLGRLSTYGAIAQKLAKPKASRAVGSAVGSNPVAFLIPCHRVIQSSGVIGQYHWGRQRKTAMIGWEAAQLELDKH